MRDSTLSKPLFAILTGLVEERTGLHYEPGEDVLFTSKLMARAEEAGFDSPLDYYYFLRYDDPDRREFDALTETLVVNETYFFREATALRVACDDILAPLIARGERPRVWCAASSTGEEPMTLAILLAERDVLSSVDLVASDISPRTLQRAREGIFGRRAMRAIDPATERRWFVPSEDRTSIRREICDAITYRRVNLLDESAVRALGEFDLILCRNVLIYFREDTVKHVVGTLGSALKAGGRLVVGASESLLRFGTMLTCEERGGAFFYRKPPA